MENYPKISIVTPNYNQEKYLEETILSVLNQGYPNLEYIIIDGGSTDGSVDIIKKYADKLAYWESVPDKGMYDAIRKGFEKSTGEIMAWINSDDMYQSKSFFTVSEIFSKYKEVNWLLGFPSVYDAMGRIVECPHTLRQWSKYDLYIGQYQWIQQESVFWRRSLWEKAGSRIESALKYAGDFELWFRFFNFEKLYVTTAILSGFRMRDGEQLSMKQKDAYDAEIRSVLKTKIYTEEEQCTLKKYNKRKKQFLFLSKFRILNAKLILDKFKLDNFGYPPVISFDRHEQCFKIENQQSK